MKYPSMRFFIIAIFVIALPGKVLAVNTVYDTFLNSGWEARKAKNYTKAEKYYIFAAELNPLSSDPKVGLLYTYIENGDFIKAEAIADQYLKSDPDNLWIRKGAAWTFYNRGRYDDAIDQYSYVLKEAGEDHSVRLGLGLSLYFAGRKKEAREACLACREYIDKNDERLKLCLGEKDPQWSFSATALVTYTDYSDSITKEASGTVTTGFEVFHRSGLGTYLQGSAMMYSQKETNDTYHQYSTSSALFYSTPVTFLWGNWTHLNGDYEGEESANIYSLYGSRRISLFHAGIEGSKGYYDGFETFQYQPELGLYWGEHYLIKLGFIVQESSGEKADSLTDMKTRYSTTLDFTANFEPFSFNLSGYYGEQWFTVEDQGLNIWNSDEELEWGGKLNMDFHSHKKMSYYLSLRVDKAGTQFGYSNEFYTMGITTGVKVNF